MGKFALWSQSEWVSAIGHHKMESFPGKATLKKNLKKALTNRNLLFPLQQIPASIVRQKPVPEQLEHWFSVAFVVALTTTDTAVSGKTSISHKAIDDAHRKLCRKHMLKKDQPTEKNRQRWLLNKCHGLQQVSIHSSK